MIKNNSVCFDSDMEDQDSDIYSDDDDSVSSNSNNMPWVEKYRPRNLDDIIYQDEIIKVLKTTIKTGNLPHLLLYGPAGTGKTSTILAVAKELFGPVKYYERVIELNASDERGINIVRQKIITFTKLSIGNPDPNYISPSYKIIILDEADSMTKEAQSALRKIMEDYSSITRFCFICNYVNQIIEPINSRCVKFRFRQLSSSSMYSRLEEISSKEKILVSPDGIQTIIDASEGDLRKGIMLLQNLKYINKPGEMILAEDITSMIGVMPQKLIDKIKNICFNTVQNHQEIIKLANKIIKSGYPIQNILLNLNKMTIESSTITDMNKAYISIILLKNEKKIAIGSDEYIQLLNIFMQIKNVLVTNN
jgi:replication factor C subunit 2/4